MYNAYNKVGDFFMKSINVEELKNITENIIDLRSIEKYNDNHIPNSINIPSEKILLEPNKYLNKNETYYLYCQKGMSSYNICRILTKLGYKTVNINGGYERWLMTK